MNALNNDYSPLTSPISPTERNHFNTTNINRQKQLSIVSIQCSYEDLTSHFISDLKNEIRFFFLWLRTCFSPRIPFVNVKTLLFKQRHKWSFSITNFRSKLTFSDTNIPLQNKIHTHTRT